MSKYTFKAEPGIRVTVEVEQAVRRLDAIGVAQTVLHLYQQNLLTIIDTAGEDITNGQEELRTGERGEGNEEGGEASEEEKASILLTSGDEE